MRRSAFRAGHSRTRLPEADQQNWTRNLAACWHVRAQPQQTLPPPDWSSPEHPSSDLVHIMNRFWNRQGAGLTPFMARASQPETGVRGILRVADDVEYASLLGVELGPLRENLPFLTRALRTYIRAENADFYAALDAEQGEIVVLSVIGLNPGMSQNDLAATLVFKKSAITKLVKDLEARGYLERTKSSSDRRFNALQLSAAGQERYARISDLIA